MALIGLMVALVRRQASEPAMMVALILYAYARGTRSSRAIERACVEDVAYRGRHRRRQLIPATITPPNGASSPQRTTS
jgi:hypothetical protein